MLGKKFGIAVAACLALTACNTGHSQSEVAVSHQQEAPAATKAKFKADREAILAMVGDFKVTFDFTETVAFQPGYKIKEPYITGGYEIVRVVEDTDTFISLQHILVVGDGEKMPEMAIKHWRQDWTYEPKTTFDFVGANTWKTREVSAAERAGAWEQTVYQVDDAPRYAGIAKWDHSTGSAIWTSPTNWRPLPRRDATKRDDYHVIAASNRHAITPNGWVHEQDNAKLILTGDQPELLAHEIGVNTYSKFDDFKVEIGTDYWEKTAEFWALVRAEWAQQLAEHETVGLTLLGEPSEMYMEILGIATGVADGEASAEDAAKEAVTAIQSYITYDPEPASTRLQMAAASEQSDY